MKMNNLISTKKLPVQIIQFGIVGSLAALIHLSVVILLVSTFAIPPLFANLFAFIIAFNVSYFGHRWWTFNTAEHSLHQSLFKFFVVAALSFILNETLFYIFLYDFHLFYALALLLVLIIVPPLTFLLSKFWAFTHISEKSL
ncbi:MAG: GtrA family protein [Legionellales bacterium]|nr:GtrA family protein [Legionellales bacterium]